MSLCLMRMTIIVVCTSFSDDSTERMENRGLKCRQNKLRIIHNVQETIV